LKSKPFGSLINIYYIRFDELKNRWVKVKNMNTSKCTLAALPSPNFQYIYTVGGFNGSPLNVVERYSIVNDQWDFITPMKRARFMHACCLVSIQNEMHMGMSSNNMTVEQDSSISFI
jgi:hypothetical protein